MSSSTNTRKSAGTEEAWNAQKHTIHNLYIVQDKSLLAVKEEMSRLYHFNASKAQYERHFTNWGWRKYLSKHDWGRILREKRQNIAGQEDGVDFGGIVLTEKRLKKGIQRYRTSAMCSQGSRTINLVSDGSALQQAHEQNSEPIQVDPQDLSLNTDAILDILQPLDQASNDRLWFWHEPLPILSFFRRITPATDLDAVMAPGTHLGTDLTLNWNYDIQCPDPAVSVQVNWQYESDNLLRMALLGLRSSRKSIANPTLRIFDLLDMVPIDILPHDAPYRSSEELINTGSTNCMMTVAVYMVSNGLIPPEPEKVTPILLWLETQHNRGLLKLLDPKKDSTSEALVEHLFRYIVLSKRPSAMRLLPRIPSRLLDAPHHWFRHHETFSDMTALQYACVNQNLELVSKLIEIGASVEDFSISNLLHRLNDIFVLERKGRAGGPRRRFEVHEDMMRLIVKRRTGDCINKECRSPIGNSALGLAAFLGDVQLLAILLTGRCESRQCEACYVRPISDRDNITINESNAKPLIQLLIDFEIPVSVRQAIGLQNMKIVNRSLDPDSNFTYGQLEHICLQEDVNFISTALEQYFHRCPQASLSCLDPSLHEVLRTRPSVTTSEHVAGNIQVEEITDSSKEELCNRMVTMILNLPEQIRKDCLHGCLSSEIMSESEYLGNAILETGIPITFGNIEKAIKVSSPTLICKLIDNVVTPDRNSIPELKHTSVLQAAVERGNMTILRSLLDSSFPLHLFYTTDPFYSNTRALAAAILESKEDMISILLERGVSISLSSSDCMGLSPLAAAVKSRNRALVQQLISMGAKPNDNRAIFEAVTAGEGMIKQLLAAVRPVLQYRTTGFGIPALQLAILRKNIPAVRILVEHAIAVHEPYFTDHTIPQESILEYGFQPMESAVETALRIDHSKTLDILKVVLTSCKDLNMLLLTNGKMATPLALAIKHSNSIAVDFLIKAGVDVNVNPIMARKHQTTPLHEAVMQGDKKLVERLLMLGADARIPGNLRYGDSPLQIAATIGSIPIARLLIGAGADVNGPGAIPEKRTALERAAEHGRLDMVHFLVQAGARISGDIQFEMAKRLAEKAGYSSTVRLLKRLQNEQAHNHFQGSFVSGNGISSGGETSWQDLQEPGAGTDGYDTFLSEWLHTGDLMSDHSL